MLFNVSYRLKRYLFRVNLNRSARSEPILTIWIQVVLGDDCERISQTKLDTFNVDWNENLLFIQRKCKIDLHSRIYCINEVYRVKLQSIVFSCFRGLPFLSHLKMKFVYVSFCFPIHFFSLRINFRWAPWTFHVPLQIAFFLSLSVFYLLFSTL